MHLNNHDIIDHQQIRKFDKAFVFTLGFISIPKRAELQINFRKLQEKAYAKFSSGKKADAGLQFYLKRFYI